MDYVKGHTIVKVKGAYKRWPARSYKKLTTGICYSAETPDNIINHCEYIRENKIRCLFRYGDINTGEDWGEIHEIYGYIGRSAGSVPIPLLIYNRRASCGGALLTSNIVAIFDSTHKQAIYVHPHYHIPKENLSERVIKILKPYFAQIVSRSDKFVYPE